MLILVDTNVLLRLAKPNDPEFDTARTAIETLHDRGDDFAIVPQCCYEYYVVATRSEESNGLGMTPDEARAAVEELCSVYRLHRDETGVFDHWLELLARHDVRGKPAHDARLVAAMLRHGVDHILTFNGGDFRRYSDEITILEPAAVVSEDA